jgi:hypothetical protein
MPRTDRTVGEYLDLWLAACRVRERRGFLRSRLVVRTNVSGRGDGACGGWPVVPGAPVGVGAARGVGVEQDVAEAGDAVEELLAGVFEDEDGGADSEADDGVGELPAGHAAQRGAEHGQGREPGGAGVEPSPTRAAEPMRRPIRMR